MEPTPAAASGNRFPWYAVLAAFAILVAIAGYFAYDLVVARADSASIECAGKTRTVRNAPGIDYMDTIAGPLEEVCENAHYDAIVRFGDGSRYEVRARYDGAFTYHTPFVAILAYEASAAPEAGNTHVFIYSIDDNERYELEYEDTIIGVKPDRDNEEFLRFEELTGDFQEEVQAALIVNGVPQYRTYVLNGGYGSNTFTTWMHSEPTPGSYYRVMPGEVDFSGTVLQDADDATFVIIDSKYAKDAEHVYVFGTLNPDLDAASFTTLGRGTIGIADYTKDRNAVYYYDSKISEADPATFVAVSGQYAKDAKHLYSSGTVLERIDVGSFEIFSDQENPFRYNWVKDKNGVYYYGYPVDGADPATFRPITATLGMDAASLFFEHQKVEGADVATFEHVPGERSDYYKDARQVYVDLFLAESPFIPGADPATFVAIGDGNVDYGKDARHVFIGNRVIEGADPASFEVIPYGDGGDYGKDKSHVFVNGILLPGADPLIYEPPAYDKGI